MGEVERAVQACLERIAERESAVGAWAFLDRDLALVQARTLDGAPARGPLHGLAVGVKDIIDTVDMPTECGSLIYAGRRASWDAACVAAIRIAGGVVLGKTVTTEFALSHPGTTRNPHALSRTPGGSSSGSAAAVADGMAPLALGTQTGGSVIRPASFCGVVGYKPSFGFVARHGVKPVSESLDTIGTFARTVREAALLGGVIARRPQLIGAVPAGAAPRLVLWRSHEWREASPETADGLEGLAKRLGARQMDAPRAFAGLLEAHRVVEHFEMAQALAFEWLQHKERLSRRLRDRIEHASHTTPQEYEAAQSTARACRAAMRGVFAGCDALIAPAAPGEAPEGLESTGNAVFNRGWTTLGLPCITLPLLRGAHGLPIGVQLVGPYGKDAALIGVARWIEREFSK